MSRLNTDRTRHWRTCETCNGSGEVFVRHPLYGQSCCPYPGDDEPCPVPDCIDGEVTEWDDPLILMRLSRSHRFHPAYRRARTVAMKPVTLPKVTPAESYIARMRRVDPMVAEVLGPVFDAMFPARAAA